MARNMSASDPALTCGTPPLSNPTTVAVRMLGSLSVRSVGSCAAAAQVHTPLPGLSTEPSAGIGPAPTAEATSSAAVTSAAPASLATGRALPAGRVVVGADRDLLMAWQPP